MVIIAQVDLNVFLVSVNQMHVAHRAQALLIDVQESPAHQVLNALCQWFARIAHVLYNQPLLIVHVVAHTANATNVNALMTHSVRVLSVTMGTVLFM